MSYIIMKELIFSIKALMETGYMKKDEAYG